MAENIMRALSRYAPDLLLLLALYLLLLRRWAQQGGRRVFVYTAFYVYLSLIHI